MAFAEQAELTLLVPHKLVRDKPANALVGEYTLQEGIEVLLAGTGLIPTFSNQFLLSISTDDGSAGEGDTVKTTKKAGLVAVLAGVLTGGAQAQEPEVRVETGIVSGQVTDARTGANLRGAKVTIEETGQWVSTGDLGRFRFASVPPGEYTLNVSFLGYVEQSVVVVVDSGLPISESFALRGGSDIEEIVVFGTRSARAQSLNLERTAANSTTVLASDFLGNFTGDTISEALRLAPGVAFQQDPLTGEGTNIIIRGLEPDLNMVTLNGVRLPDGSGIGRSADLSNILTESISKVTISKTLLPSQDSTGTGGLVEIETKSPLDRDRRFASLGIELIDRQGNFGDGLLATGTLSGHFGQNESLGISVSTQYRDSEVRSIRYSTSAFPPVVPLSDAGDPLASLAFVDPRLPFPFDDEFPGLIPLEARYNDSVVNLQNRTLGATLAYRVEDHTDLRLDIQYLNEDRESFTTSSLLLPNGRQVLVPVPELNDELRFVLATEDAFADFGFPGITFSPTKLALYTPKETNENITASFQGETRLKKWTIGYDVGYAIGEQKTPVSYDFQVIDNREFLAPIPDELLADNIDDFNIAGRRLLLAPLGADVSFPSLLLNEAGYAFFNDPSNYNVGSIGRDINFGGENERYSGTVNASYEFDGGLLDFLNFGFFYEESKFTSLSDGVVLESFTPTGTGLDDYGVRFSSATAGAIGIDPRTTLIGLDRSSIVALLSNADSLSEGINPLLNSRSIPLDDRNQDRFTKEVEIAGFFEAGLSIGRLQVIGGLRFVHVEVEAQDQSNSFFTDVNGIRDDQFEIENGVLFNATETQSDVLVRVLTTYRFDGMNVLRAGFYESVARPQIQLLSGPARFNLILQPTRGPNGNQPGLFVSESNPDLRPAHTRNYDVSFERYSDTGVMKASLFYKATDDFLQTNNVRPIESLESLGRIPNFPEPIPDNVFLSGSKPRNGDGLAEVWGIELSVEQQLTWLPGRFDGLGFFVNYTYSDSERRDVFVWENDPVEFNDDGTVAAVELRNLDVDVRFNQQPKHSGTAAITYNKYDIDASLSYSIQSRRLTDDLEEFGLDNYDDEVDSLDFRAQYWFGKDSSYSIVFKGLDLLRGSSDATLSRSVGGEGGVPTFNTGATYFGGRSFQFGLTATF